MLLRRDKGFMPPRRRRAGAPAVAPDAPPPLEGVLALPAELQQAILGQLDLNTRLNTAALVCKLWRDFSVCAGLLQTVEARLLDDDDRSALLSRMQGFCRFLWRRAAPHVLRLNVVLPGVVPPGAQGDEAEERLWDALEELGGALREIGYYRRLQDLSLCIHLDGPDGGPCMQLLHHGAHAWPRALRSSLRSLRLSIEPMILHIDAPLQVGLARMQQRCEQQCKCGL